MKRLYAVLVPATLLGACASSPPTQFFTLDPVGAQRVSSDAVDTSVQVAAVHVPATLDRQEMVRRTAPDRLDISDRHRWAAPLDEMVRRVLTQDLARRLAEGKVVLPQQPASSNTDAIVIDILQFESDITGTVSFDGSWSLVRAGSSTPGVNRPLHLSAPARPANYASQAQAMSNILGQIADMIAAEIANNTQPDRPR